MKIISVSMQKGGVSKTTTTINLGTAFGERGKRVLLIDLDPQSALTISLGFNPLEFHQHVYHVLLEQAALKDIIIPTKVSNVDLTPTNIDLSGSEIDLNRGVIGWERILSNALQAPAITSTYDLVLIDNPPMLGCLMTNALVAAHLALIPLECSYLAIRALDWLNNIITEVQRKVNPGLMVRIVRTRYDPRTLHSREASEKIAKQEGDRVLKLILKEAVALKDASLAGQPILLLDGQSEIANAYRQLAKDLESYLR